MGIKLINYIETSTSEQDGMTVIDFIPILEKPKSIQKIQSNRF